MDKNVKSVSGKILQFFWSLFLLIFLATYMAFLAAAFSEEAYTKPIESIEDIPNSNHNLCTYDYIENQISDERPRHPILTRMLTEGRIDFSLKAVGDDEKFVEDAKRKYEEGCIFLADDSLLFWLSRRISAFELYKIEGYFTKDNYAFVMNPNWTWAPNVTEMFTRYDKSGYFDAIARKYAKGGTSKSTTDYQGLKTVEMSDVYLIFLLTFGGAVLSILVTVIQYLLQVKKRNTTSH